MAGIYVPPGGFIGAGQMTAAGQMTLLGTRGMARTGYKRKRKSSKLVARIGRRKAKSRLTARKRRSPKSKRASMVKGSAAARRHMAKLRRMRRK